ncbi:hypothetical protein EDC04DRAFT_2645168 [Pisolithus marmoratus]|nr:hypothetical protein EDC04DRAFT_2645168 [Pisolithus marmoratus]
MLSPTVLRVSSTVFFGLHIWWACSVCLVDRPLGGSWCQLPIGVVCLFCLCSPAFPPIPLEFKMSINEFASPLLAVPNVQRIPPKMFNQYADQFKICGAQKYVFVMMCSALGCYRVLVAIHDSV